MTQSARAHIRLAELLGVLSFGADLGMGQPMEHVLRQCLISLRLAERMGLDEADQEVVYYTSLLAWVGCHVDAYEQAKWFGDEMALKSDFRHTDFGAVTARPLFILRHLGAGRPMAERAKLGVTFPGDGRRVAEAMIENHWLAADGLGERLGLPQRVRDSVEQTFERWDGKGVPKGARGEQILLTSRLVALADVVEVFHRAGGTDAAVAVARQRRGTQFDPQVVDVFTGQAASVLAGLDEASSWDAVIGAEPAQGRRLTGPEFDTALEAIADFTDVKSPYTIGHSRGVADLAGEAARVLGLGEQAATTVRRAGLVHDLGAARRAERRLGQARPGRPRGNRARSASSLPHRAHVLGQARPRGVEADRADQQPAPGFGEALGQLRQRRAALAGHALYHARRRQPDGFLGQEHQGRPLLLGRRHGDQERHGDLLGILQTRRQADDRLAAH